MFRVRKERQRQGLGSAWALCSFLGMGFCGQQVDASEPQRMSAVPIEYRAHLAVIQVEINGKGPFDVVVDTGADVTVIDAALAAELRLPVVGKQQVGSPMADELMSLDEVRMQSLRIGDAVFTDVVGVSMDLQAVFAGIKAPHAVLAAASFKDWLMTVDFPAGNVSLREGSLPASDGIQILDYTAEENVPSIPVLVGGVEIVTALDTGAPSTLSLPSAYQDKLTLQSEPMVVGSGRTVDATFEILGAPLKGDLVIGQEHFENPQITFNSSSPIPVLGMRVLGEFRLTLDSTNHRIEMVRSAAVEPAASPTRRMVQGAPSGTKRYGIMFGGLDGDALKVTGVEEGQIAAAAGLQSGDLIVGLNDDEVASLNNDERMAHLRGSPLRLKVERGAELLEFTLSKD